MILHSTVVVCRRMRAAPQTGVSDDVGTWSQRRNTGCKVASPPVHHTQVFGPRQPTLVGVGRVLHCGEVARDARHGCRQRSALQWPVPEQHGSSSGEITVHNSHIVCRGAATELTRKWPRPRRRVRTVPEPHSIVFSLRLESTSSINYT